MGNFTRVYQIEENVLLSRLVPVDVAGNDQPITVEEWIKTKPDCDLAWKTLFGRRGQGVRQVAMLDKTAGFPEKKALIKYAPDIAYRFEPIGYMEVLDEKYPLETYFEGSDFPPGYVSPLMTLNCVGWQFFSKDEMDVMVQGLEKLVKSGKSIYANDWEWIIDYHHQHEYNLMLFIHMI
jgi:hypothetical protein